MTKKEASACDSCAHHNSESLKKLGVDTTDFDHVIAIAGNPNTGKSTVFNALTGLRQHTGNWPGKTGLIHFYQPHKMRRWLEILYFLENPM